MRFKALTDKGNKRSTNEDNFYIDEEINFFMVADGMGGHAAGEVASQIAASFAADFDFDLSNPLASLSSLTFSINREIIRKSNSNQEYMGMGTTFAAVIIQDSKIYYVNLGDSRIYLYNRNNRELKKISKDHSLVGKLLRENKITEAEAFNHPQKNIVTQALGLDDDLDLDTGEIKVAKDDYLLLCTDGLSDMIKKSKIEEIFFKNNQTEAIAEQLLQESLTSGGFDNITLIVVGYSEE
ncbi:MAG: protein serine/threonine phosphatase [Halanaerobium sp. 4-GBenrich]|jgi:protein phosphatase|uniref:Protein phosphatase n=1 Tax=Halanaerobium congolense TaxID=54121 RepID=A0A1G8HNG9_9FIRM|nr:Stp1/IreP family PP2C-type Ser/Thr phosphatase [Halanaerobium congolense]ODS50091.1 MAG: protein serine/threonine phosphatase [Halanaerobium sp. 4-GBenrich]OEG63081.1 MAG: serine/threonine protein phosphatase [Halanaerobium sp. MDAL1]PXV69944.1 protein phosphatase [Halanaerobium congolense]TDS33058.1 protein phosphatase [Halanaerobium congolense]SDI08175.1 protein phosphatase [Halanaerobium congolense]